MIRKDIENRLNHDFIRRKEAKDLIINFIQEFIKQDMKVDINRLLRSIIYLANGNIDKLEDLVKKGLNDFRDLIYWAEYDEKGKKRKDFSKSF